tara:strand:- start:52 stop:360 length:309 start_codon:yes stop_codon:yes gene_type:complete
MTYTAHQTKTIVDTNNTLWNMEYDGMDNSVTIVSDRATSGGYAVLSQYSLDNALGHDIPMSVQYSAEDMIAQDNDDLLTVTLEDIIESYADEQCDQSKQFYA